MAQAVWAIINGKYSTVEKDFKEAYRLAEKYGHGHDSAIILECIAKWFIKKNQFIEAKIYLLEACEAFSKWGALKKVQSIEQDYAELLTFQQQDELQKEEYLTIVRSAQTISQEIELDRLLHQLLLIMLQHAGAQYGALVFYNNNKWEVEAFGSIDELHVESIPLEEAGYLLPISLISYVASSAEVLVLHDMKNSLFGNNDYVKKHDLKSVLCLPILHQNKLLCILYIENNLYNRAFTEEKLSVLKLLSSQIAISITNARLYADIHYLKNNLEKQVEERTESLQKSMKLTNEAITEMTLYAERNRIAQEIHDIVGHTLTSTILQIEAGRRLISKDLEDATRRFKDAQDLVRHSLNEIRNSVHMLKEDHYYDLNQAIHILIEETKYSANVEIISQIDDLSLLPQIIKKLLYHALQEGLTNGIKHGKSTTFYIKLVYEDNFIKFDLKDNGQSMVPLQLGFGLKMMQERVEQLNGEFMVIPHQLKGFTLIIKIPLLAKNEGVLS